MDVAREGFHPLMQPPLLDVARPSIQPSNNISSRSQAWTPGCGIGEITTRYPRPIPRSSRRSSAEPYNGSNRVEASMKCLEERCVSVNEAALLPVPRLDGDFDIWAQVPVDLTRCSSEKSETDCTMIGSSPRSMESPSMPPLQDLTTCTCDDAPLWDFYQGSKEPIRPSVPSLIHIAELCDILGMLPPGMTTDDVWGLVALLRSRHVVPRDSTSTKLPPPTEDAIDELSGALTYWPHDALGPWICVAYLRSVCKCLDFIQENYRPHHSQEEILVINLQISSNIHQCFGKLFPIARDEETNRTAAEDVLRRRGLLRYYARWLRSHFSARTA